MVKPSSKSFQLSLVIPSSKSSLSSLFTPSSKSSSSLLVKPSPRSSFCHWFSPASSLLCCLAPSLLLRPAPSFFHQHYLCTAPSLLRHEWSRQACQFLDLASTVSSLTWLSSHQLRLNSPPLWLWWAPTSLKFLHCPHYHHLSPGLPSPSLHLGLPGLQHHPGSTSPLLCLSLPHLHLALVWLLPPSILQWTFILSWLWVILWLLPSLL